MKLSLPFKKDLSKKSKSQVTVNNKNKFAIVESYKIARTNIMFSLSASEKKAFAVTSYSKGEGKSTVASNLADLMFIIFLKLIIPKVLRM